MGTRLKSAALRHCKFLGAGRRVSIAHVVGATRFPGGGSDRDPSRNYSCFDETVYPANGRWCAGVGGVDGRSNAPGYSDCNSPIGQHYCTFANAGTPVARAGGCLVG